MQENKLRVELTTPINLSWTTVAQNGSKGEKCDVKRIYNYR